MNTRVKALRKKLNLSQQAFGQRLGVTAAGISKIESADRHLTEQMLRLICNEFGVNEQWIRSGEGEAFRPGLTSGLEQLARDYQLDETDIRIINEYITLDTAKRLVIKEYIMKLASMGSEQSNHIGDDGQTNNKPVDNPEEKCS